MNILTQLLSGAWWLYLIIVIGIYLFCLFLNYVVKKMNETKIEERIKKLESKESGIRLAECETRLAAITLKNEIIRKGQTFIFDDKGNNLNTQKSLFSTFSSNRNYSHRSMLHHNPTNNKKSITTSTDIKSDSVSFVNKISNGNIVKKTDLDINHSLNNSQIEEEVKQFLSDILKNIKD